MPFWGGFDLRKAFRELITGDDGNDPNAPPPIRRKRRSEDGDSPRKRQKLHSDEEFRHADFWRHAKRRPGDAGEGPSGTTASHRARAQREEESLQRRISRDESYISESSSEDLERDYDRADQAKMHKAWHDALKSLKEQHDWTHGKFTSVREEVQDLLGNNAPGLYDDVQNRMTKLSHNFSSLIEHERRNTKKLRKGDVQYDPNLDDGRVRGLRRSQSQTSTTQIERDVNPRLRAHKTQMTGAHKSHQGSISLTGTAAPHAAAVPPVQPVQPAPTTLKPVAPTMDHSEAETIKIELINPRHYETAQKIAERDPDDVRQILAEHLKEPAYAFADVELRDAIKHLQKIMLDFVKKNIKYSPKGNDDLESVFSQLRPETTRIIGYVASGGPEAGRGWKRYFLYNQDEERYENDADGGNKKGQALALGIIGKVIEEQVWQHSCFGATQQMLEEIQGLEWEYRNNDGFQRNALRADALSKYLFSADTYELILPARFTSHVAAITTALWHHLTLMLQLHASLASSRNTLDSLKPAILASLNEIVTWAGIISLQMRLNRQTVYHFVPFHKDQFVNKKEHELLNGDHLAYFDPTNPKRVWLAGEDKHRAQFDRLITQVTILPGITAYRQGGWETPSSTPEAPKYEKLPYDPSHPLSNKDFGPDDSDPNAPYMGIRSRELTKAWVSARWGRPRVFDQGVPADNKKEHGPQWVDPGFVEFRNVKGVTPPSPWESGITQDRALMRQFFNETEEAIEWEERKRRDSERQGEEEYVVIEEEEVEVPSAERRRGRGRKRRAQT